MKSPEDHLVRLSLACLFLVGSTQGGKILLIPMLTYSHCQEVASVGQELADRGHDVVIFLDAQFNHKNCYKRGYNGKNEIRSILFQRGAEIKSVEHLNERLTDSLREGRDHSIISLLLLADEFTWHQCSAVFSDQAALNVLKGEHFDLAIVDGAFPSYCFFVLPYKLKIRYIALTSWLEDIVSARPFLPSIVPAVPTGFTDRMTFSQRLINTIAPLLIHMVFVRRNIPMDVIARIAPELSTQDVINLVSKSELFLYNYDTVLSYPVPTMPNHVLVGGIGAQPAAPLTGGFKDFYQDATYGVVVVSFGSIIGSLPSSVTDNLVATLDKLNIAVLWKHTKDDIHGKIKRVQWLPQNDVLGHPKTRLFVSHCGNNGVFEALYHGVPLVCTPIDGEQFYNGIKVQRWTVGLTVSLMTSSAETLFNAIDEVLTNSTYKTNMVKASEIYHSRPETARERAAFWIEHVLRFGGDHLKSAASDMSVFTYRGYDVFCFILGSVILMMLLIIKTVLILYRCCRRRNTEKIKTN